MSDHDNYSIEVQFYIVDSKIAITKSGNSVTEITEKPSLRTYPDAKRIAGKLWINDIDYYEAIWEYNPALKIFEVEAVIKEFSKIGSNKKDSNQTSLGSKHGMCSDFDFLDDMYDLYSNETAEKDKELNKKSEPFAKCECGSDSANMPFHSDWCPKDKK
jgi:hypothetical protein